MKLSTTTSVLFVLAMTAAALPAADHTVVADAAPSAPAPADAPAPSSTIDQAAPAPNPVETSDDFDETYDDQVLNALAYAASAPDADADADATSHHNDKRDPGTMQPKKVKPPKAKKPKQYMWCTANTDYCTSWYAAPGQTFQNAKREVEKRDGMSTTTADNKKDQEVWCNGAGKCVYWHK
jgi:hypothetical protein